MLVLSACSASALVVGVAKQGPVRAISPTAQIVSDSLYQGTVMPTKEPHGTQSVEANQGRAILDHHQDRRYHKYALEQASDISMWDQHAGISGPQSWRIASTQEERPHLRPHAADGYPASAMLE